MFQRLRGRPQAVWVDKGQNYNCSYNFGFYLFKRPEDDHVMVEACSHMSI